MSKRKKNNKRNKNKIYKKINKKININFFLIKKGINL
jgi:hypothetical protein